MKLNVLYIVFLVGCSRSVYAEDEELNNEISNNIDDELDEKFSDEYSNAINDEVNNELSEEFKNLTGKFIFPGLSTTEELSWEYGNQAAWTSKYATCGGMRQSPINIETGSILTTQNLTCIRFRNYHSLHVWITFKNNGHTIETSYTLLNVLQPTINGGPLTGTYKFASIHWHWGSNNNQGSEHTIDGAKAPIEMHLVHYHEKFDSLSAAVASGESEALAVVGVRFKLGIVSNPGMAILTRMMKYAKQQGLQIATLPLGLLRMEFDSQYYTYLGSLTTPPCHQIVRWIVLRKSAHITKKELNIFRSILVNGVPLVDNYRAVQPLNGRTVTYHSRCNKQWF